ncbi:MAG: MBL fold metallo-hydrolase, partial [Cyanobacteria bacterium REEB65]|nr:MBL fold metallo-hydrolase [Cyanobacteria bacterium REEB65]
MTTRLHFLGAAGCVTGSRYLLEHGRSRILVDCGLFQGPSELEELNWKPLPIAPSDLDAVVLTHAHLDHSGYLPRWVAEGFAGPIHCTGGTADLLSILLPDAGFLQEEEALHANRKGWSRHRPALPLFTMLEAQRSLRQLQPHPFDKPIQITEDIRVTFQTAGHIVGSAILEVDLAGRPQRRMVFSGDIGRPGGLLLQNPTRVAAAQVLVVESTYGDRLHPPEAP